MCFRRIFRYSFQKLAIALHKLGRVAILQAKKRGMWVLLLWLMVGFSWLNV